ncbi:MAG: hypothetical protein ABSG86_29970 [Thermoguttaceae bacterium]|jgi:Mrp family chromosome partitioning ATPase
MTALEQTIIKKLFQGDGSRPAEAVGTKPRDHALREARVAGGAAPQDTAGQAGNHRARPEGGRQGRGTRTVPLASASPATAAVADAPSATMPQASLLMELAGQFSAAAPLTAGQAVEPEAPLPPAASPPATLAPVAPAAPSTPWRPMLQVDCLGWPDTANRLEAGAIGAIDSWTEGVNSVLRCGHKVLGFGSAAGGEGVTTLMLIAARRLAGQCLRVAVVDADLAHPGLAEALGLLPEAGWEASLSARLPLKEVAVESITDRLTVVPLLAAPADPPEAETATLRAAADLDTLAQNYDAVLVDLGGLCPGAIVHAIRRRLDALLLVQSVRSTTPDRIAALEQELAESGIVLAGIVQNFVAG